MTVSAKCMMYNVTYGYNAVPLRSNESRGFSVTLSFHCNFPVFYLSLRKNCRTVPWDVYTARFMVSGSCNHNSERITRGIIRANLVEFLITSLHYKSRRAVCSRCPLQHSPCYFHTHPSQFLTFLFMSQCFLNCKMYLAYLLL